PAAAAHANRRVRGHDRRRSAETRAAERFRADRASVARRRSRGGLLTQFGKAAGKRVPDFLLQRLLALTRRQHHATLGVAAGNIEERLPEPPVPIEVFLLEAVAGRLQRSLELAVLQALEGRRGTHVQ